MASFKIVFFFTLVSFLNFATSKAQEPVFLYHFCSYDVDTFTSNSTFQLNMNTLRSSLSSNATATGNKAYYYTSVSGINHSDSVNGLFMCRGDVPSCGQCVVNATRQLSSKLCPLHLGAVIWYDVCMVWYSNIPLLSTVNDKNIDSGTTIMSPAKMSNPESFNRSLSDTMMETAEKAANSNTSIGAKKYATMEASISVNQSIYCLAQCLQDMSPKDCRSCLLHLAIPGITDCCALGAKVLLPGCNIRYELYPFYRSSNAVAPGLVPETNHSYADSKYSEDPCYLYHVCTINKSDIPDNTFLSNLKTLMSSLSSSASGNKGLTGDSGSPPYSVYGLFMCRGDVPPRLCEQCVVNATERISAECKSSKEAIIWYNHCLLRYSDQSFFYTGSVSPSFQELNITANQQPQISFFTWALADTLSKAVTKAKNSDMRYGTESLKLNGNQTLYTLAQCTLDLTGEGCDRCLSDVIGSAIPWSRLGSIGGRVLYPSCNVRFELFQFYRDGDEDQTPTGRKEGRSRSQTIVLIVVPIIVSMMLLSLCCYVLHRKARKSYKRILREIFGHESSTLEPLQFRLAIVEAATNNFSNDNKIGKGGFGEVYKGILPDGRDIAVKRLSRSSKQGALEFKNEILLIAKLQHRNLVTFMGFCLEEQEKILIYEYVPNKSLDYFLFDTHKQRVLSWFERYNIIGGIARGILYLHEYSRLKVIHRDLKPSNILLDENMNPKISDFGMARIVEIDQDQGNTNRIVGTYGYMSPEYAMLGQFSEKSDVFSFGVMVLEIITGKKNASFLDSHHVGDSLLSYVWRQWMDQTPLSILDPTINGNYSQIEVSKFIHISLLCVQVNPDARPTMATVVSYLSGDPIELPSPQEPTFFLHDRMPASEVAQAVNNSMPFSINEMSMSKLSAR